LLAFCVREQWFNLLPIQLHNLAITLESPIYYPPEVDFEGHNTFPRMKQQLFVVIAVDCQSISNATDIILFIRTFAIRLLATLRRL
jgi:hypothetical protein